MSSINDSMSYIQHTSRRESNVDVLHAELGHRPLRSIASYGSRGLPLATGPLGPKSREKQGNAKQCRNSWWLRPRWSWCFDPQNTASAWNHHEDEQSFADYVERGRSSEVEENSYTRHMQTLELQAYLYTCLFLCLNFEPRCSCFVKGFDRFHPFEHDWCVYCCSVTCNPSFVGRLT